MGMNSEGIAATHPVRNNLLYGRSLLSSSISYFTSLYVSSHSDVVQLVIRYDMSIMYFDERLPLADTGNSYFKSSVPIVFLVAFCKNHLIHQLVYLGTQALRACAEDA